MRKNALLFVLISAAIPVQAQFYDTRITFGIGDIGFGMNTPVRDTFGIEASFSILNFGLENDNTNLGLSFTPLRIFGWTASQGGQENQNDFEAISLFNLNLYWNVINPHSAFFNFFAGPFVSVNYLFIEDSIYWNRFIFTAGAHVGVRFSGRRFNYNLFSAELGYRRIGGANRYHISARIDFVALIAIMFLSMLENEWERNGR